MFGRFKPVESFDRVWAFELVWSLELFGSFDIGGPLKLVGSFESVGLFKSFWLREWGRPGNRGQPISFKFGTQRCYEKLCNMPKF